VTYGGDSENRIFVLYWRCPLIRVSVIRGSTVFKFPENKEISLYILQNSSCPCSVFSIEVRLCFETGNCFVRNAAKL
jgi:hypothetical protein